MKSFNNNFSGYILRGLTFSLYLTALILFVWPVNAGQATYFYDDLGRLSQVIDDSGNVATYTYDAVGNLLSITRSTGGLSAPTITSITPNQATAGTSVSITISGQNLQGASLTTDNPGITVQNTTTSSTSINANFSLDYTAKTGTNTVGVATSAGTATSCPSCGTSSRAR